MGRTKAKKKIPPMPPLGLRDKLIYALGYLLILAVLFLWLAWIEVIPRNFALREPGVVAHEVHGSLYWCFPFFMTLFLSLVIPWGKLRQYRYPFFGKRGVKYGPPAYPRTFPLFMKNKPQYWKSPSEARFRRNMTIFVVVLNLLFALLLPFSLNGRDVLCAEGSVRDYSMFNHLRRESEAGDAESVTVSIGWNWGGRHGSGYWEMGLSIDYGDRRYKFYDRSFGGEDWVDDLAGVLEHFDPEVLQLVGLEHLDDYGRRLSEENFRKLQELFETFEK